MVALLGNREEVKSFLKDILTLSEVVMISRRIQVARMLLEGEGYEKIKKALKVGGSTISHVERWLHNGFGGYKKMIGKYNRKYKKIKEMPAEPFSREWVRKKYPMHYFLSNLLDKK